MNPKRAVAAFFLTQLLAAAGFAQEYGRVSDGPIELMTKHARPFSGSISLTTSLGSGDGYGGTVGGTLVPDRIWFFASAEKSQPLFASQYGVARTVSPTIDAQMIGQIGNRQNLAASFAAARPSGVTIGSSLAMSAPSSFLSLHYTGIVSDHMFVSGSFSELQRSSPRY